MQSSELEIFDAMPFLFWVKSEEARYLWGNRVINGLAGEDVTGKPDSELVWADNAEGLRSDDLKDWASGKPSFVHEYVAKSERGDVTLNVCKRIGDYEGQRGVFGISFVIED